MLIAVITIGRSGSSELISILNETKLNVIKKPFNHLYPNELLSKFGKDIKVIFITRAIKDILVSLINRDLFKGLNCIKKNIRI